SMEDAIFLFLLTYAAFTDRERKNKMKELAGLDRKSARTQKLRDDKNAELGQAEKALTDQEALLQSARAKVQSLETRGVAEGSQEMRSARERLETFEAGVERCEADVARLEHEYKALQREDDQSPKSRDIMFMELERLTQDRDKLMNMVRSVLEKSDRNIEKIFR
ncbi:MAG: hypothetical protein AAFZ18_27895, partial [Myxococcota bacterium]